MKELIEILGRVMATTSIALLLTGIIVFVRKRWHLKQYYLLGFYLASLLVIELTSIVLGHFFGISGLVLFTLSFFIHFVFLSIFYQKYLFQLKRKWVVLTIGLGILPLLLSQTTRDLPTGFQSYDRAIYSFVIMLYSLYFLYQLVGGVRREREEMILNSGVLIFFALDAFLAIGTNFLVNESLVLVGWFWIGRALTLQFFYASMIHFLWRTGKIPKHH